MTRAEVDAYFAQISIWMKNDIRREIALARATRDERTRKTLQELDLLGGGNLLAALGLVAYSEALGQVRHWNQTPRRHGSSEECFLAFFDEIHDRRYRTWRETWERDHPTTSVYETLRCGLVHEYRPKVDSEVWIGDGGEVGLAEEGDRLIFKVEPYYRHFCAEADQLYEELKAPSAATGGCVSEVGEDLTRGGGICGSGNAMSSPLLGRSVVASSSGRASSKTATGTVRAQQRILIAISTRWARSSGSSRKRRSRRTRRARASSGPASAGSKRDPGGRESQRGLFLHATLGGPPLAERPGQGHVERGDSCSGAALNGDVSRRSSFFS